jgi:hypothetical protein
MATAIEQVIPHLDGETLTCARNVEACQDIFHEVQRATAIHRGINSQHEGYAVILEELDEFWELVKINPKKLTEEGRAARLADLRKELIQTAAMCVRTIVDLKL